MMICRQAWADLQVPEIITHVFRVREVSGLVVTQSSPRVDGMHVPIERNAETAEKRFAHSMPPQVCRC